MRVVETLSIFLRESNYEVVDLRHLRDKARQLDEPKAVVPPTIILMSPRGGLGCSFSLRATYSCGGSVLSLLTNLRNFPCLIRVSICCFKS